MVDHIVKAASILSQPHLEDETITRINAYIRIELERLQPPQRPPTKVIDPFAPMAEVVDSQFGPGIYDEWVHGAKEADK